MKQPIPNTKKGQAWHDHLALAREQLTEEQWNAVLQEWKDNAPATPPQSAKPTSVIDTYIGGRFLFFFQFY